MRLDGVLRGCAAEAVQGRVFGKRSSKMHSRECVTEGVRQRLQQSAHVTVLGL